jgi:hypothetical protein
MELIAGDVEAFHCGFADLDTLLVAARVECAFDLQTGLGRRRADQFDESVGGPGASGRQSFSNWYHRCVTARPAIAFQTDEIVRACNASTRLLDSCLSVPDHDRPRPAPWSPRH